MAELPEYYSLYVQTAAFEFFFISIVIQNYSNSSKKCNIFYANEKGIKEINNHI